MKHWDKLTGLILWIPPYVASLAGLTFGMLVFGLLGFPIGVWKYLYGIPFALIFYHRARGPEESLKYVKQMPDTEPELKVLRLLVWGVLALFLFSALLIAVSLESTLNELGVFEWYDAVFIPLYPLVVVGLYKGLSRRRIYRKEH